MPALNPNDTWSTAIGPRATHSPDGRVLPVMVCNMRPASGAGSFIAEETFRHAAVSCLIDMLSTELTVDASVHGSSHNAKMISAKIIPMPGALVHVIMEIYAPDWSVPPAPPI